MNTMSSKTVAALAAALLIGVTGSASAAPVDVSYTVTGTAGNWTLDFNFANNLTGSSQYLYFLGVNLDPATASISGLPNGFYTYSGWNGAYAGGQNVNYALKIGYVRSLMAELPTLGQPTAATPRPSLSALVAELQGSVFLVIATR